VLASLIPGACEAPVGNLQVALVVQEQVGSCASTESEAE
jgi:hypothetical protein